MDSKKLCGLLDRWSWILIYAGLFALVLGLASMSRAAVSAWTLITLGGAAALIGAVMIWVRSRLDCE